jgi:mono/diheme cytochrome c family protein
MDRRLAYALTLMAVALAAFLTPNAAFAYNENFHVSNGGCGQDCHALPITEANCASCHTFAPDNTNFPPGGDSNTLPDFPLVGEFSQSGPHGAYKSTTDRCAMCHTLHDAPTGFNLLPGATVKAS